MDHKILFKDEIKILNKAYKILKDLNNENSISGSSPETSLLMLEDKLLSSKEIEIMIMICEEKSNKEISKKLRISHRTIEGYRSKIIKKTNSRNVVGVVKYAIKNKLYVVN